MNNKFLSACLLAATTVVAGCSGQASSPLLGGLPQTNGINGLGAAATGTMTAAAADKLDNILGNLLGASATLKRSDLVGTWRYTGPDCVFESENLLMQAGGAVATTRIESKLSAALAKVGIKPGSCSFTFRTNNTYSAVINGRNIAGNYILDVKNKKLTMTYLGGMATMSPQIVKAGNHISLLYEANKLLTLLVGISTASGNTGMTTLGNLLSQYNGLLVGIRLQK